MSLTEAKELLKKSFGYTAFYPVQEKVVASILDGKDTVAVMPTGGGKSLCYQIPSQVFKSLTVVVSPLISLMKDQVDELQDKGIGAVTLNSSLSQAEYLEAVHRLEEGAARLLYVAPETLFKERVLSILRKTGVSLLAVDEAHCISSWGHDFRPEYRLLAGLRQHFPGAVIAAFTATATPQVRDDIVRSLELQTSAVFQESFDRDNLFIEVLHKANAKEQAFELVSRYREDSGIIYCYSRKQVESLAAYLNARGISAGIYHAGLSDEARQQNQEAFINDRMMVMVATVAFGMGINKPDVRFVIHLDLPKNMESYYQEIGRAGRDGLPARCVLLYSYADVQKVNYHLEQLSDKDIYLKEKSKLARMVSYCESLLCRRRELLAYFGETYKTDNCRSCDRCLTGEKNTYDLTEHAYHALRAIECVGQAFGISHVIDLLRGANTEKIRRFNHNRYDVYGIGKHYTKNQWSFYIRQMITGTLISVDHDKYGILKITPEGRNLLQRKREFWGIESSMPLEKGKNSSASVVTDNTPVDSKLYDRLKSLRRALAQSQKIPPYMIFSNKTLLDMSAKAPGTIADFLKISGVGEHKAQKYGEIFLKEISSVKEG